MTTDTTPLTQVGYAAILCNDKRRQERTLPVPPGLTHDEAVAWCAPYLGADERVNGFAQYSF